MEGTDLAVEYQKFLSGITNLGLNLLTVKFLGLYGIVLSTIVSMVIISAPWITSNIFKLIFKRSAKDYVVRLGYYFLTAVIATLITNLVIGLIPGDGWIGFIVKAAVCVLASNIVVVLMLFKIPEFSDAVSLIARMLHIEKFVQRIQKK